MDEPERVLTAASAPTAPSATTAPTVPSAGDLWQPVVTLIEDVMRDPGLLDDIVNEVRSSIREIAGLDAPDVARHTRILLAASTRAMAERRGPTATELAHVEDLARVRARQGVAIHAVLAAIHVAERRVWARARVLADTGGTPAGLVLEARGLYDDWAHQVRERLIIAHASVPSGQASGRDESLVRRLLTGGSAAALAAREADAAGVFRDAAGVFGSSGAPGTPRHGWEGSGLVVAVAADLTPAAVTAVAGRLRATRLGPVAADGDSVVAVWWRMPRGLRLDVPVGVSAPTEPEALPVAHAQARTAARAAARRGLTGVVPLARVAALSAVLERDDLAGVLIAEHAEALTALRHPDEVLSTVAVWLECRRDADAAAARLFVHPNTVRNRVHALTGELGLDPNDPFQALDMWWLCTSWPGRAP